MYLDVDAGILGFVVNGLYYGPAYVSSKLKQQEIYPAVAFMKAVEVMIEPKPVPLALKRREIK